MQTLVCIRNEYDTKRTNEDEQKKAKPFFTMLLLPENLGKREFIATNTRATLLVSGAAG